MKGISIRGHRRPQPSNLVCQFCQYSTYSVRRGSPVPTSLQRNVSLGPQRPKRPISAPLSRKDYFYYSSRLFATKPSDTGLSWDPETVVQEITQEAAAIQSADSVPSDESVVQFLQKCQRVAEALVTRDHDQSAQASARNESGAISSLLDLEEKGNKRVRSKSAMSTNPQLGRSISQVVNGLLQDKKIFISPEALACYTEIHVLLKRAEHFPKIFHLYAHKPVPEENSSPIKYHEPNSKSVKSAIPTELANKALDVAIAQKNLSLVLAIIDNSFCAPAFYRAKVFKKAAVPLGGLAAAPAACYALASWASTFQSSMDPSTATGIAFAAILAYVGSTSSVGMLAITTSNDQMERVVWLPGVPLRHRWLREEERAALDKVAVAWGFKDVSMRGEEEGEEWDNLREFIGMRGMILDKTDLMEGMQ
ncbi:hypothetical protein ASPZODRAFT_149270 [Penicilliopsis zonata CBS 506.65]|uniref:Uncharacterized protein n=1 Tax=Penicilliopsis zonata CBS 506.65 TaxID=1073090 RepID=A0A1L9SRG0_9EURO|nr:hypothetical protein ASPZODRAFT_149270 [Penicilliopsis zonata CBS 506.65]OJJ49789.1 hypothetical protein ASPZODRAFT_149270 [Penicilliopsis zonata CBS 506.65]